MSFHAACTILLSFNSLKTDAADSEFVNVISEADIIQSDLVVSNKDVTTKYVLTYHTLH